MLSMSPSGHPESAERRRRAVAAVLAGASVTKVASEFGVSRQAVYFWLQRFQNAGEQGLLNQPRMAVRRDTGYNWTSPEIEQQICLLRQENPQWSVRRIRHALSLSPVARVPSEATIRRVLVRHELNEDGLPVHQARQPPVQRRVPESGRIMVLRQRITVGRRFAGKVVTVHVEEDGLRVEYGGRQLAYRPCNTSGMRLHVFGKGTSSATGTE